MNHLINYFYHQINVLLDISKSQNHQLLIVAGWRINALINDMCSYMDTLSDEQTLNDGLIFNFKAMGAEHINKNFPELQAEFHEERLIVRLK